MNTVELRKVLAAELYTVRSGRSKPERSRAVQALAGKIIASYRLDLEYARLTKQHPIVPSGARPLLKVKKNKRK